MFRTGRAAVQSACRLHSSPARVTERVLGGARLAVKRPAGRVALRCGMVPEEGAGACETGADFSERRTAARASRREWSCAWLWWCERRVAGAGGADGHGAPAQGSRTWHSSELALRVFACARGRTRSFHAVCVEKGMRGAGRACIGVWEFGVCPEGGVV